ncbi:MAG: chemotaxis protein CheB [Allosphingosinicella sp.]|uniref:chemotaxis protein CheB n=1 Tax=Allosphingosinicella sp. TaxID=2823234 RepID=UPI00392A8C48
MRPIRLMIVDDSAIARAVLSRMVASHRDLEVVALAGSAAEAIDALASVDVDIVLLDLEMPGSTGLEAMPEIIRRSRGARILIVSSACEEGARASLQALSLGAADTLSKPGTGLFGGRFSDVLADKLRRIGRAHRPADLSDNVAVRLRAMPDAKPGCIAVAASTGGLLALNAFLAALPLKSGLPILITQHLPALFMPFFARQIEAAARRPVRIAEDGDLLVADELLVAPGNAHLKVERTGSRVRARLCRRPAPSGCLPSADPMFDGLAEAFGPGGVAVLLSGMGRDGLIGATRLAEGGGAVLAQDRSTSAVWGMPRAVAEAGIACAVLPPAALARRIVAHSEGAQWN